MGIPGITIEAELPSILDRGPYNLQFLANNLADFMYKMADIYKSLGSRLDSTKLRWVDHWTQGLRY